LALKQKGDRMAKRVLPAKVENAVEPEQKDTDSPSQVEPPNIVKMVVVNCEKVNVRKDPLKKKDNVLFELPAGTQVFIEKQYGEWYRVHLTLEESGDDGGFINGAYLNKV
jgi:SH3-like domain-containing protein